MIKYKHKISGEIAEESPRFKNFYLVNHGHSLHKRFIENSNDWQKVEELDYDIIKSCPIEGTIYSVKRLSDGEVFTIGDEATVYGDKMRYKIIAIQRYNNWIQIVGKLGGSEFYYQLKFIEKLPKRTPLFTTEDGVEIFEGDNYSFIWLYNPATNQSTYTSYTFKAKLLEENCAWSVNAKYFSTKEKAEEYVLLNKPCLSIMEVAPIFGQMHLDNSPDVLTRNLAKLKSLVQAKL